MRVAVCCKGVPVDAMLESVQIVDGDIQCKGVDLYINEFDTYALEAALELKNTYGVETLAVSLGPLRVQEVLYFALAKGIDKVLRIHGEASRPELITEGLIPLLRESEAQLILVGVQSEDWMGGEVGIYLSQALNMGVAYAVTEIIELNDSTVRVRKELGQGRTAEVVLKLPAVLCVQSGIYPLRYVAKAKLKRARKNPIQLWGQLDREGAMRNISGMTAYEIEEVLLPSKEGRAEMIEGDRSEKAIKLLDLIDKIL